MHRFADQLKDRFDIAAPSVDIDARLLSGGNLQRLILAREITSDPPLMVAVQPTRGLDVGAISTVHRLLLAQREAGSATLLISEDLDEVLGLSDRVAVMYEGRIVGLFDAADADVAEIGLLMIGGSATPHAEPGTPAGSSGDRRTPAREPGRARIALPWTFRLERRLEVPRWLPLATTIGAVVFALVISGVVLALAGGEPIPAFIHIVRASFGSLGVISDTLVKATPLILTGLACALAFRMRLWNIGAEGQFLMGAWAASAVVLIPIVPDGHARDHHDPAHGRRPGCSSAASTGRSPASSRRSAA